MLCGQDIHQLKSYIPAAPGKAGPEDSLLESSPKTQSFFHPGQLYLQAFCDNKENDKTAFVKGKS